MKTSWVEVDLGALGENICAMRASLGPGTEIIFVVKDRAYGHGLLPVAHQAIRSGVGWLAVAHMDEALEIRREIDGCRILVLGVAEPSDVGDLVRNRIIPIVVSEEHGVSLHEAARQARVRLAVHLKIDTGMGRLGVPWEEGFAVWKRLSSLSAIEISGLCTHFASVEAKKPSLGAVQMERFRSVEREITAVGGPKLFRHVSSSRAILYQGDWDLDGVRPGIALYGYGAGERGMRLRTRPLLQWKTGVIHVKKVPSGFPVGYYSTYVTPAPTTLATLAVGYADGYHRALSNKGAVLIRGRRCPVVGRVSMNWITVDAGPDSAVRTGEEAVLIGRQGQESIWAGELARLAHTIPYEILTSINPFARREYVRN